MFPNLQKLTDTPVARTNLIQLEEAPLATIRRLLVPISDLYVIDFGLQRFNKERKEKSRDYHARVHREIKVQLRQTLGLDAKDDVKYELHRLPSGQHVYFYLAPSAARHTPAHQSLATRIEQVCQQLTANKQSLARLIQGLFGLHLKMILLEQAADRFPVCPVYFNAVMYLNARLSQPVTKKSGTGVMEAFELDVFASDECELAFTLHKRKFLVEPAEELHLALDDDKVWFNTDSGRVKARRMLDARDTKLEFFRERSGYGDCQAYTYNVVMNAVVERLTELEIPHAPIPFQATHEVNQFVTDLDQQLANTLLVVNNGVDFSATQEAYFFNALAAQLPGYQLWPVASLEQAQKTRFSELPSNTSVLVLNPVNDDAGNSIRQLCDDAAEHGNFFSAYDTDRKQPGLRWDTYTQLKLDRLNGWLQQEPLHVSLQGMNIDSKLLKAINYIDELSKANPDQYTADLKKPRSRLKSAVNLVNSKIRRTKTELWFKESLLTQCHIPLPSIEAGRYTVFAVRSTDNGTTLLGHVELTSDGNQLSVANAGVTEGDLEWLAVEHPALARLKKLFNDSFYLYDHAADVLLTTYNSVRVPRLIGPSHLDVVDLYSFQEQEKKQTERDGDKFSDYTITRSAKAELNVLPYLMSPGRSIQDPLTKSQKMKHHHAYLQPHDCGLYVLISDSQPANPSMARPNLVENLLIWDAQGEPLDVFSNPLTGVYLNSFTLDMLKSGDSSKSSIFAKLARLMVEN
ncbi:hypothetical protein [Vibrio parahaemolyticus]|uniref:hypothetical protein n=1 Tax=Vibrio parahaemolyticus TaxID=670 RepID=UPI0015DE6A4B|nr:hypothetical protein [Vibrio parahaemolyticus]HCG8599766.1 hypothetical protein [Vibrio parahaemolyticus]